MNNNKHSIEDFTLLACIGKGSFARVILAKKKNNGKIYAIKIMKKKYIQSKNKVQSIINQKQILISVNHPFIPKFYYSFQNQYCPGGQLFRLLQQKKILNQANVKFYSSQIVMALQYLHQKQIIYREQLFFKSLKPQNVLIDQQGYIKLTDFGLSKIILQNDENTYSMCGTPQYMAPQILRKQGYTKTVDWWCFGCLIYQMVRGKPPFYFQNRYQLFKQIKNQQPNIPSNISIQLKDLLKSLFNKNPQQRLGNKGALEIKNHKWFVNVNWNALLKKQEKAPFIPIIKQDTDISNFDIQFTSEDVYSEKDPSSGSYNSNFDGFDWCHSLSSKHSNQMNMNIDVESEQEWKNQFELIIQ